MGYRFEDGDGRVAEAASTVQACAKALPNYLSTSRRVRGEVAPDPGCVSAAARQGVVSWGQPLVRWRSLLPVMVLVTACASTETRIGRFLDGGNYEEALALLEARGAGATLGEDVAGEDLEARIVFADRIWKDFGQPAIRLIEGGEAMAAQELLIEGVRYCAWSAQLAELHGENDRRLERLWSLQESWSRSGVTGVTAGRQLISEVKESAPWLDDAPELRDEWLRAWGLVVDAWSEEIATSRSAFGPLRIQALDDEFQLGPWPTADRGALSDLLTRSHGVERGAGVPGAGVSAILEELCGVLDEAVARQASVGDPLSRCFKAIGDQVTLWCDRELSELLAASELDVLVLSKAEALMARLVVADSVRSAIATGHVRRSEELAVGGTGTLLARVHLERACQLDGDAQVFDREALLRQVEASMASVNWPVLKVGVEIGAGVPPPIQSLVEFAIRTVVDGRARGWTSWEWVDTRSESPDVRIRVDRAKWHEVNIEALESVTSTHYSHSEQVPNPRRASLKSQLDFQEITVDSARSSYESAVQSFNWNPTEWGLASVNWARTRYNSAVNQYNTLVNFYNSAPILITQPVYLAYSFKAGEVAFGWELEASASMGDSAVAVKPASVERDFARIGSKRSDRVEEYRTSDPIDFDVSVEAAVGHLLAVAGELVDAVDEVALAARSTDYVGLSEADRAVLAALLHPSGFAEGSEAASELDGWLLSAAQAMEIAPPGDIPPVTTIFRCPDGPPEGSGPVELSAWYRPIICDIRSTSVQGIDSRGSGVLVSGDGLLLTCAHVVHGAECEVILREGPWRGTYEAAPLFVNEQSDLALLKVDGLRTQRWAPIRFGDEAVAGEGIIALGNPGLDGGGASFLNVTEGIVSNPSADRGGGEVLVADISISSGSSGGPLVATRDGCVVGVVQAVGRAGFTGGSGGTVASSGFTCLAAPSTVLGARLGLEEGR